MWPPHKAGPGVNPLSRTNSNRGSPGNNPRGRHPERNEGIEQERFQLRVARTDAIKTGTAGVSQRCAKTPNFGGVAIDKLIHDVETVWGR